MATVPTIPKGTRDFGPEEMTGRNYIFDTIRSVFGIYGYQPLETPAIENISTLLGKYGEEGDRLLFRILNSGDFLSKTGTVRPDALTSSELASKISDKGLRYDLTVPFARFVVQNRNSLSFPFRRYQIQPVWRADRPQKGRYREFYQCDVDVIGSDSLVNEYELIMVINDIFSKLKIRNVIKINNRKILGGIAEKIGEERRITDITVAIDKLEKIGIDGVLSELQQKGVSQNAIEKLRPLLFLEGSGSEKLAVLRNMLEGSDIGIKGVEELEELLGYFDGQALYSEIDPDISLARGLNYYTGAIIEVKALDYEIGSICGGGRYDDLTGIFGMPGVSGVGVSFGADRIYDVMVNLGLFPRGSGTGTVVLILNFGGESEKYSLRLLKELRDKGIRSEIYPDRAKLKKQLSYANSRAIPYVIMAGDEEMNNGSVLLKDMNTGKQDEYSQDNILPLLTDLSKQ